MCAFARMIGTIISPRPKEHPCINPGRYLQLLSQYISRQMRHAGYQCAGNPQPHGPHPGMNDGPPGTSRPNPNLGRPHPRSNGPHPGMVRPHPGMNRPPMGMHGPPPGMYYSPPGMNGPPPGIYGGLGGVRGVQIQPGGMLGKTQPRPAAPQAPKVDLGGGVGGGGGPRSHTALQAPNPRSSPVSRPVRTSAYLLVLRWRERRGGGGSGADEPMGSKIGRATYILCACKPPYFLQYCH